MPASQSSQIKEQFGCRHRLYLNLYAQAVQKQRDRAHIQGPRVRHVPAAEGVAVAHQGKLLAKLAAVAQHKLHRDQVWGVGGRGLVIILVGRCIVMGLG